MKNRPLVLSIAGFDPTGGAGVLADIKTFEQNKTQGFAVITANTIQTENTFVKTNWIDENIILEQVNVLLNKYTFKYVKIGLIPSLEFLNKLLNIDKLKNSKIIWDTILKTSSGFEFKHNLNNLEEVLKKIYFITPNWNEIKELSKEQDSNKGAEKLSKYTNVYLKGGHSPKKIGKDYLYTTKGKLYPFNPMGKRALEKHGSGCVFSSALTANFARSFPLIKGCLKAKKYTTEVLESNKGLLGYHKK